jgi:hypothetical protein
MYWQVKNVVSTILDGLITSFSWVLMLLERFTLTVVDTEGAEDVCNLMTNNGLSMIADEFQGGTTLDDVIFQCVDKLLVFLDAIHISDLSVHSNKYHIIIRTSTDGWDL